MARTTRGELQSLVGHIARRLHTEYGYAPGQMALAKWSPGDGWTRYKVQQSNIGNGGVSEPFGSTSRSAAEMYSALQLALHVLDYQRDFGADGARR